MTMEVDTAGLVPPLRLTWKSATGFGVAAAANNSLYGISSAGNLQALRGADGSVRWEASQTYIPKRLAVQGSRLFAYQLNRGLAYIDDNGDSASERLAVSFAASADVNMSTPVLDDRMVYLAVNRGLYAVHQDQGLQYAAILSETMPHMVALMRSQEIIAIDGKGIPTRYHAGATSFEQVWVGADHGIDAGQSERPFIVAGNLLILGIGPETVAYDLSSGQITWRIPVTARAFALQGGVVYAAFLGAALWAIRVSDGAVLWQRQYIYDLSVQREFGVALSGDYVYFGGALAVNPDGALLMAVNAADGSFTWLSRGVAADWAGGIPLSDGAQIYSYTTAQVGAYAALPTAPRVSAQNADVTPRPLGGPASGFGTGRVRVTMPVGARVSISPYRETQGPGTRIVDNVFWSGGLHEATWTVAGAGGFTDANQFGYMLVDVTESGSPTYTLAVLLPDNTFPDILGHWAEANIEVMAYHKMISGYEDQTFRPDGLVTRAESSTMIAKTLGLNGPSPGFHTRFSDIATHWARNYIMALEEQGIVGGFAEPGGGFTFRPDLNMTRAEEAKILVKAYRIPDAPAGFATKFTDIAGHWAEPNIKALEAAGYVNGFQEPDGSFTYRPEQNLTRAELCTVVVRIQGLTR